MARLSVQSLKMIPSEKTCRQEVDANEISVSAGPSMKHEKGDRTEPLLCGVRLRGRRHLKKETLLETQAVLWCPLYGVLSFVAFLRIQEKTNITLVFL